MRQFDIKARSVSQAMCEATMAVHNILAHQEGAISSFGPNKGSPTFLDDHFTFATRVGNGKRTCCTTTYKNRSLLMLIELTGLATESVITYGAKMVTEKLIPEQRARWRCAREIAEYGFFGGDSGLLSNLAGTILHEYAHFLVVANFAHGSEEPGRVRRKRREVHGKNFYSTLTRLHAYPIDGGTMAAFVKNALKDELQKRGIDLDALEGAAKQAAAEGNFQPPSLENLDALQGTAMQAAAEGNRDTFSVGEIVKVPSLEGRTNCKYFRVTRINDKTVGIESVINPSLSGRASPALIFKVDEGEMESVAEAVKAGGQIAGRIKQAKFTAGEIVEIPEIDPTEKFKVIRVNQKTLTVGMVSDMQRQWRVSPALIKVDSKESEAEPTNSSLKSGGREPLFGSPPMPPIPPLPQEGNFLAGDIVSVPRIDPRDRFHVVRVNSKTVTVALESDPDMQWRVSPSLIKPIGQAA